MARYYGTQAVVGEYLGTTLIWSPDEATGGLGTGPLGTMPLGGGSGGSTDPDLVWSTDFPGDTLDTTTWNAIDTGGVAANNELQDYAPGNVTLSNGRLVIEARKETRNGKTYTSGKVTSNDKVWIGPYGRIIARIHVPAGTGLWPAFWLLGDEANDNWWPECGEIDVMETVNDATWLQGTVHGGDGRKPPSYTAGDESHWQVFRGKTVPTLAAGFHEYRVDWTQDRVEWFLDGVSHGVATPADMPADTPAKTWPFNGQQMYLLLNLAVGGNMLGDPIGPGEVDESALPAQMLVDWVRVYSTDAPPPGDTTPPTAPNAWVSSVVHTGTTATINLAWSESYDTSGVAEYLILRRSGTTGALDLIDTVTGGTTTYADTGQAVGTWQYAVRATDAAGNTSDSSNIVSGVVTPPSSELVANPTFDADVTGWTPTANTTITRVVSPVHGGAGALRMTAIAAGEAKVESGPFTVDAAKVYMARAYVRAATTGRATGVQVDWYNNAAALPGHYIDSNGHYAPSTTTYTERVRTNLQPPAGAVAARIAIVVVGCAAGEQHYADTVAARLTGDAPPPEQVIWTAANFALTDPAQAFPFTRVDSSRNQTNYGTMVTAPFGRALRHRIPAGLAHDGYRAIAEPAALPAHRSVALEYTMRFDSLGGLAGGSDAKIAYGIAGGPAGADFDDISSGGGGKESTSWYARLNLIAPGYHQGNPSLCMTSYLYAESVDGSTIGEYGIRDFLRHPDTGAYFVPQEDVDYAFRQEVVLNTPGVEDGRYRVKINEVTWLDLPVQWNPSGFDVPVRLLYTATFSNSGLSSDAVILTSAPVFKAL